MLHIQRIVNSVFASNTYVISHYESNEVWLVDIGDIDRVIRIIPRDSVVKGVFLTHTHFDHIYGINMLHQLFPRISVYTSEYGKEALYSAKKNFSQYHEKPIEYEGGAVTTLHDGNEISLYHAVKMIAYETPGHCMSCLSYTVLDNFFTGDSYIPNVKVVTRLPKGDKHLAEISLSRIIKMAKDKIVYPGHGEIVEKSATSHCFE